MICPCAYRYGYVCPKGAVKNKEESTEKTSGEPETAKKQSEPRVEGGANKTFLSVLITAFLSQNQKKVPEHMMGGADLNPRPLKDNNKAMEHLVEIARKNKTALDGKNVHYKNDMYERIRKCAMEIESMPQNQRTNANCVVKLADDIQHMEEGNIKTYFQSLLAVMTTHMYSKHKHEGIYKGILAKIAGGRRRRHRRY